MKGYFGLTVLCVLMDFVNLMIVLGHFGNPGEEDREMILLMLSIVFFGCNVYWVIWSYQLSDRFPEYISEHLKDAS